MNIVHTRRPLEALSLMGFPKGFIEDFFSDAPVMAMVPSMASLESALAVDLSETDKAVVVRANVPGFRKEEIAIEVHDGVLTIRAEHSEQTEVKEEKFHRKERRSGAMLRSITLPAAVAEEMASAELKDGVLTLTLPKHERVLPKRISIG